MGHRNTQFTGHTIDMQNDQPQPELCIFYGSPSSLPQPNAHPPVVPANGNRPNYNFRPIYGMPQLNSVQPHHPGPNLDLAVATPGSHCNNNPYFVPPLSANFLVQPNHVNADVDVVAGIFKRKNVEGVHGNFQHHNPLAGPTPPVAPSSESEQASMVQGGFAMPPVGLPWLDVHFRANNGDVGAVRWVHTPLPYVRAPDISASNRSLGGFLAPYLSQGHLNPHHPPPPVQGIRVYNNLNLPSQVSVTPPRHISTIYPSNSSNGIAHIQEVLDVRPAFVTPLPPMGFCLYRPQQRELLLDSTARPLGLPHLRVLPEDEVAMLEMPGYQSEAGNSIDHHRDMRLDIDHMSYEELLELGEQIGSVGTGLPKKLVRKNLKTKSFASSAARLNLGDENCPDQQMNFCVICQNEYELGEKIGTVDCGHEYHKDCINKWLLVKNTCPICKSTALGCTSKAL